MKQHVTYDDLFELTVREQIDIATMFGQYGNCSYVGGEKMNISKLSEKITIGKMIEVLIEKDKKCINIDRYEDYHTGEYLWEFDDIYDEDKELCNILWTRIKKLLYKEKING